jgi:C4-dicarboxylate transporter DctM subunit
MSLNRKKTVEAYRFQAEKGFEYMDISYLIVLLILLGTMAAYVPVFMCLFFTAVLSFIFFTDLPLLLLVQTLLKSLDNFALVVVLFFILCGNIMTAGSIVDRLIKFANVLVSWLPGGLGMAGVLACGLFGAISGSTVATVVALGSFMIPALLENGYKEDYTLGVMTTSPNLGVIIPPSIGMILYSMISNVSLEGLFLTGFMPGILIMAGVCVYTYFVFRKDESINVTPIPNPAEFWAVFKESVWSLLLPVIIFGGIFSGMFTANEAAVVACVYAFIVELFIHKSIRFKDVKQITVSSAVTSATLLIIVSGATCFGRYLTLENLPGQITSAVIASIQSPVVFLLVINILLLVIGMFMDIISATLILGPVFLPMLHAFNIDPVHFGLIMTVNLAIGYCTPPMGVSLYITGAIADRDLIYVSRAVLPFVAIQLFVLVLITYMPDVVLWLPRMLGFIG